MNKMKILLISVINEVVMVSSNIERLQLTLRYLLCFSNISEIIEFVHFFEAFHLLICGWNHLKLGAAQGG